MFLAVFNTLIIDWNEIQKAISKWRASMNFVRGATAIDITATGNFSVRKSE